MFFHESDFWGEWLSYIKANDIYYYFNKNFINTRLCFSDEFVSPWWSFSVPLQFPPKWQDPCLCWQHLDEDSIAHNVMKLVVTTAIAGDLSYIQSPWTEHTIPKLTIFTLIHIKPKKKKCKYLYCMIVVHIVIVNHQVPNKING